MPKFYIQSKNKKLILSANNEREAIRAFLHKNVGSIIGDFIHINELGFGYHSPKTDKIFSTRKMIKSNY